MEKTRQAIPEGLADRPPGPGLAAALATIDLTRLSGLDCVEVLRARQRQASHDHAQLMAAMVEVALCGIGPDDQLPRMDEPDEFAADEIRGALAWTRRAADTQLSLAWDLIHRLPGVFAALDTGAIDVSKTKVFSEWTHGLTDAQAHEICERLLPEAAQLTTGQLAERIKKMAIAIDPDWARRRYEEAIRDRKVVGYRNEDGSANLSGYNLPADRVAAACAHIDALAKKIKRAGVGRPIDHIRADLFVGMVDGSYQGWIEQDIIKHMLTEAVAEQAGRHNGSADGPYRDDATGDGPARPTPASPTPASPTPDRRREGRDGGPSTAEPPVPCAETSEEPRPPHESATPPDPPARRAGVEIRAEVTMLLGLNAHPAEIAGWGFIHAEAARTLVFEQTDAEWRYAVTDNDGHLLYEGTTRRRPDGYPPRANSTSRGGIVELHIKQSDLRRLAERPARLGGWAKVIADLARKDNTGNDSARGARRPGVPLWRRTQIRDRTCVHPGCRAPAHATDGDHTRDWAHGGPTIEGNLASLCRHDHRLKHEGGWQVSQPQPGHLLWTSRLGVRYHVRPPLIIEPLPSPIPRDPHPQYEPQVENGDAPIWRTPTTARHAPDPRPPPPDEDPPF